MIAHWLLALTLVTPVMGFQIQSAPVFTLYRTSLFGPARIHVATFDADESGRDYNRGNCRMVMDALHAVPGTPQNYYWCEPGHFRAEGRRP